MSESTKASLFLYLITILLFVGAWKARDTVELSAGLAVFGWATWMCAAEAGANQE